MHHTNKNLFDVEPELMKDATSFINYDKVKQNVDQNKILNELQPEEEDTASSKSSVASSTHGKHSSSHHHTRPLNKKNLEKLSSQSDSTIMSRSSVDFSGDEKHPPHKKNSHTEHLVKKKSAHHRQTPSTSSVESSISGSSYESSSVLSGSDLNENLEKFFDEERNNDTGERGGTVAGTSTGTGGGAVPHSDTTNKVVLTREEETDRKKKLIEDFAFLENRGYTSSHRFTLDSDIREMELEIIKLRGLRKKETISKYGGFCLFGAVKTIENGVEALGNAFGKKFDFLSGWSGQIKMDMADFEPFFEEATASIEKSFSSWHPAFKLGGMLALHGMYYAAVNKGPSVVNDIFSQIPTGTGKHSSSHSVEMEEPPNLPESGADVNEMENYKRKLEEQKLNTAVNNNK